MKKLLSLAAVVIGLNAYQIDIKSGWQLKGALEDINVTDVFNEAEIISVWTYDDENGKWRAYLPNVNVNLDSYGIEPLNIINKGEGFWVNANNNLFIEIDKDKENILSQDNGGGYNVEESSDEITEDNTNFVEDNVNMITEDNLIDKPTTFELSDIANKTFKVDGKDDFIDLTFDSNGVANMEIDGKNYEIKLENGIIKVYENNILIPIEIKKVKADNNGIILLVKNLEDNKYRLWSWLTTLNPVDMSTLNYPFTVYEADSDEGVKKIIFETNKVFKDGKELNSTIEDGKIVAIDEKSYDNGNSGYKDTYKIQYIGEIDKYKIAQVDDYYEYWRINDNLIDLTFNDIIDTNQSILYGYILNSDGTVSLTDGYSSDANITYQLISPTEINLTKCYDGDCCFTKNITLDPSTGKVTKKYTISYVEIHSEDPIIKNYVDNNSYRVLPKNNSIKDRVLQKHKKLRKKPF